MPCYIKNMLIALVLHDCTVRISKVICSDIFRGNVSAGWRSWRPRQLVTWSLSSPAILDFPSQQLGWISELQPTISDGGCGLVLFLGTQPLPNEPLWRSRRSRAPWSVCLTKVFRTLCEVSEITRITRWVSGLATGLSWAYIERSWHTYAWIV